ncbi:MAG TPA: pitrilysin family protein, partial [Thermoanaerobaculia bacterium]|nr:pitrilysin family protein [Thermoanaerobaculia bacterium]
MKPDLPFERHSLPNGLRVVLHPDSSLPLVTVNLWYHVGSKNERPGRTGFAHLFEHMLFQGSQHVGTNEHFRHVQQVGGVANGSTWYDRTNYYETLPASHLDLGLWLEADRMGWLLPAMTAEKLEMQRQVVMNERRQRIENQPYGLAGERLRELLYPPDHPYHWPVIGYMDDIAAATLDEVQAFFRTYYAPNNAVLTLAGDFDPEDALRKVEAWFGEIPAGPPVPPVSAPLAPLGGERREVIEDDVRLPRIYI